MHHGIRLRPSSVRPQHETEAITSVILASKTAKKFTSGYCCVVHVGVCNSAHLQALSTHRRSGS